MNWGFFRWHSLKTRITLSTLAIFVLSLWALSFYASQMLRKDMERLLGEQQFSTVSLLAAQINRELDIRMRVLDRVAGMSAPVLRQGPLAIQEFIEQRPALLVLFNAGLKVFDADGRAIADYPLAPGRLSEATDLDLIAAVIRNGRAAISQPLLAQTPKSPAFGTTLKSPVFSMAVPIRDANDQVIGVISGVTNLGIPNFLEQIAENSYGKTGGYLLVAPEQRLIITATNRSRVMEVLPAPGVNPVIDSFIAGREGSAVLMTPQGEEVLASIKRIPLTGWYAAATLPTAEAFAPIRALQQRMHVATLLLTLLAAALTGWMLRRQLSPLLATVETLAVMADSEQPLRPLPVAKPDEIGQLIGGFNRLLTAFAQRETLLNQVLDTSSVAIFLIGPDGRITQANQRMAQMFGCTLDELVGAEYVALVQPGEREAARQRMFALLDSAEALVDVDRLYWRADQTEFWGHLTGRRFYDAGGAECGLIGVIADITVRKQAEAKRDLAASVFTHAREGILITSAEATIIDVNESFMRITGYSRDEVLGCNPRLLSSGRQDTAFYASLWRELVDKGYWHGEIWNRRKSGEVYAAMQTISAVRDANGQTQQYVALFSDITALKTHEKQLEHMAHYDVLTTLPNRVLLAARLHQAMAQAQRRKQRLAVAYLDLDGFKAVNDRHGHKTGDQLLMALATRMKHTLREGDTLARLGGDEFVAVLFDTADVATCVPMLNRLLVAAAQPVPVDGLVLQVSASLGVTFYPQSDEVDADQLLRQADQAMYQAKLAGKNRYHFFDADQDRSVRGHHEGLEHIRRALTAREFVLHYQPKVNMRTGTVIGAEALIRWQHPERGLLPPALFLPALEDHPLALEIGAWVISTALTQIETWHGLGMDMPVSVNVGAHELQQADFVERLAALLAAHPSVRPGDLQVEVLETSALEDLARVSQIIEACRKIGVSFSLDDFGTGYSSLTYLKRLQVTQLKIDQSFVREMLYDPDDLAILGGVLSLATAFRRQVIAEGVETVEHGTMLLQLGCELAQGYGIARPMPAAEFPAWAAAWRPDPAWSNLPAVNRDDLPLLFAGVEHRAWIVAIEGFLRGERESLPLIHHQCRFSSWLEAEGHSRHGGQRAFQAISPLHQELHQLAGELCELKTVGRNAEALARVGELHALRDRLLTELQTLVQENRSASEPPGA